MGDDANPELAEVVPRATFIEDVAAFVKDHPTDELLVELRSQHQRYLYVEQQLTQRRQRLLVKEPEIKKCLDAVDMLIDQRDAGQDAVVLDFSLSDQVYARARVAGVTCVNLWLGAGVMLEYALEEAKDLLERQLSGCRKQIETAQVEYDYVKDQMTTLEVSIARVYNYDISRRKQTKI